MAKSAKEKLADIYKLIFEKQQLQFVDMPLADGRVMQCEPAFEVGATCMIDGQPAPDGEYPCQDGTICVIAGGVIAEIKPATTADGGGMEMGQDEVGWLKQHITDLLSKFDNQAKEIADLKVELQSQKQSYEAQKQAFATQSAGLKDLIDLVGEMAKETPAPAEVKKSPFANQKPDPQEKLNELSQALENLRKAKSN